MNIVVDIYNIFWYLNKKHPNLCFKCFQQKKSYFLLYLKIFVGNVGMRHTFSQPLPVKESKCLLDPLIALPTFSYSPTRATRDIVVEGNELEEVKTLWKAILELGWVMPHSGFGATLNPDPLRKFDPPSKFFSSDTPNFFYLIIFWDSP